MENDKNEFEELLILYALGDLEPEEALAVEEQLQSHPELADQVEKIRRTDGLLSDVFAMSDVASQQDVPVESEKPMAARVPEPSRGRLAYRLAFSVAALALVVVVGVLVYPQLINKDIQVAYNSSEENNAPVTRHDAKDGQQNASVPVKPEDSSDKTDAAEADNANQPVDNENAPSAMPSTEDVKDNNDAPNPNDDQDLPLTKGIPIITKGMPDPTQKPPLPASEQEETSVDQTNNPQDEQPNVQTEQSNYDNKQTKGFLFDEDSAPVPGSYAILQKRVLDENQLPNPEDVHVEQWLNYLGIPTSAETTDNNGEESDNKDAQFAKAVNQFATLLSCAEPTDVKEFENVLDMLKDSVGDDAKRQEFKTIVEKTIEIKKKLSE